MLDFIFAVSHPVHWHSINIHQHKEHYSFISRLFGSRIISILQEKVGGRVWFNVECEVHGRIIKYGVVAVDHLVQDLMDWETLYLAGRMQKPIHVLRDDPRIRLANQVNLSSAIRASLLLLPETFSEEDLYTEITSISYKGDFRMRYGENPNKIANIVATQSEQFHTLYHPILRDLHKHVSFLGPVGSGSIRQDVNPKAKAELARRLPKTLREMLLGQYEREVNIVNALERGGGLSPESSKNSQQGGGGQQTGTFGGVPREGAETEHGKIVPANRLAEKALWTKLVAQGNFKTNLDKSLQMIVGRPAFSQSMKGIASVGPLRGIRYVWPKVQKKWFPGASGEKKG